MSDVTVVGCFHGTCVYYKDNVDRDEAEQFIDWTTGQDDDWEPTWEWNDKTYFSAVLLGGWAFWTKTPYGPCE